MDRLKLQIGAKFEEKILCKKCGELECICNIQENIKDKSIYKISVNSQKKNGRYIIICGIFYENKENLEKILKEIKKKLATGGCIKTEKEGYILEIQGNNRDIVKEFLKSKKFKFKN